MASTKVKGIVIGGVNVKEKDRLVTLYTLEKGKMLVSMRGVRGDKAKMRFAKEIFCFGEYLIEEGKTLCVVTGVDIIDSFYSLSADIDKYYEGCAILDIISRMATESNPALFIQTIKALKKMCYENAQKYFVFNKFLLFFFKNMGYSFLTEKCSSCGATLASKYLNLEIGEIVCPGCKNALCLPISENCYHAMKLLDQTDFEKLSTLSISGDGAVQACGLLCRNYEARTGYKILSIN